MGYGVVINNLVIIFAMIGVGFVAGRAKVVGQNASADFTSFLMKVTLPCTIFSSMIREYDSNLIRDCLIIFVLGLLFFGGFMLINLRVAPLFRVGEKRRNVWVLSVSLCNIGFMGFPLIKAIFGDDGLFLASIMNLAYNMVAYSLGVKVICMGSGDGAGTNWKKILLTNNNYAVVLGLFFFITQLPLPSQVMTVVNYFGNITTPLSMFLIGLSLAGGKISEVFRDKDVITCTAMRLIIMPLVSIGILKLLPLPEGSILMGVVTVIMAMPCPSVALMLSQQYGGDTDLAARSIFLSSLCCIATIPLMLLLI